MSRASDIINSQNAMNEAISIDLVKDRYKHWNRILFNNALPTLPITTKKTKNSIMAVISTVIKKGKVIVSGNPTKLQVSTLYDIDRTTLDGIIIHELIHVKLITAGMFQTSGDKSHGAEFKALRKELQSKVDFDIPLSETPSAVIDQTKGKLQHIILVTDTKNKTTGIMPLSKTGFADMDQIKASIDRWIERHKGRYTFIVGSSSLPFIQAYPIKRSAKLITTYQMSPDDQKAVLAGIKVSYET